MRSSNVISHDVLYKVYQAVKVEAKPKRKPWEIKPIRKNYNINLFG